MVFRLQYDLRNHLQVYLTILSYSHFEQFFRFPNSSKPHKLHHNYLFAHPPGFPGQGMYFICLCFPCTGCSVTKWWIQGWLNMKCSDFRWMMPSIAGRSAESQPDPTHLGKNILHHLAQTVPVYNQYKQANKLSKTGNSAPWLLARILQAD